MHKAMLVVMCFFCFWPQYRFNNHQKDKNLVPFEALSAWVLNSKAVDSADHAHAMAQILALLQ